jgi:hypothetical protein
MLPTGALVPVVYLTTTAANAFLAAQALSGTPPANPATRALTPSTTTPPLKGASVLPPLPTSSTADASPVPLNKSTTAPSNSASTAQEPSHCSRTVSAWPAQ